MEDKFTHMRGVRWSKIHLIVFTEEENIEPKEEARFEAIMAGNFPELIKTEIYRFKKPTES